MPGACWNCCPDALTRSSLASRLSLSTESFADVEITQVTFNVITETELVRYLSSREPMDKAGAYGIQGYAARWIPRVEGRLL